MSRTVVGGVRTQAKMQNTNTVLEDERGKQPSIRKMPEDVLRLVHKHIQAIPMCIRFYSRAKGILKKYMTPGLTRASLYTHYCVSLLEKLQTIYSSSDLPPPPSI